MTLRGHAETVMALRFSHDGALLASTSSDGDVFVWEVETGAPRDHLAGHVDAVTSVDFSVDDATLYTASDDGTVLIWDLAGNRSFITHQKAPPFDDFTYEAVADPSGTIVAYVTEDLDTPSGLTLQFRDLETDLLGDKTAMQQFAVGLVWRPTGRQLATATPEGLVQVWDARSADVVTERQVIHEGTTVFDLDYTSDGEHLVVAAARRTSKRKSPKARPRSSCSTPRPWTRLAHQSISTCDWSRRRLGLTAVRSWWARSSRDPKRVTSPWSILSTATCSRRVSSGSHHRASTFPPTANEPLCSARTLRWASSTLRAVSG